jgi:dihydrofolate reductase
MRRIIVSNLMSLDGFFEGPNQELDWFIVDEEFLAYARELLQSVDTLLFGAKTYRHMAAYWPSAPADETADKMNGLPKIVFSKTLQKADWNNSRLIRNNIQEEVSKLKAQPGKDIVVFGSASLSQSLLQFGLIDEYRIILQPLLIGRGRSLFDKMDGKLRLRLERTKLLASGVIVLYYQKA